MASCFQLFKKEPDGRAGTEASVLTDVDSEICKFFNWECDPERWAFGWFDSIGWRIAVYNYKLSDEIMAREILNIRIAELVAILEYLKANYTESSFHERKRP